MKKSGPTDDEVDGEELMKNIFDEHSQLKVEYSSLKRIQFLGFGGASDVYLARLDGTSEFLVVYKVLRVQNENLDSFKVRYDSTI